MMVAICGPLMGRKSHQGVAIKRRIDALKSMLRGEMALDEDAQVFSDLLPWAVAFGVVEQSIEVFQQYGDLCTPYYHHPHFGSRLPGSAFGSPVIDMASLSSFSNGLSNLASTVGSSLVSSPSASGSGGGGSSGGGGGGGGGGGW